VKIAHEIRVDPNLLLTRYAAFNARFATACVSLALFFRPSWTYRPPSSALKPATLRIGRGSLAVV
jgi:hypothetical protein